MKAGMRRPRLTTNANRIIYVAILFLETFNFVYSAGPYCFEDVCYEVVRDPMTWDESSDHCRQGDGALARVPTPVAQARLEQILIAEGADGPVWIGAHQVTPEIIDNAVSLWRWVDDCECDIKTAIDQTAFERQGCYNDWSASPDLPHQIAESFNITPTTCLEVCLDAGYEYSGTQVTQVSGPSLEALCHCGHSFGFYGTNDRCVEQCPADPGALCGGFGRNLVLRANGLYSNWAYDQPDDVNGLQFCGALDSAERDNGAAMVDENCSENHTFVCQLPSAGCSPGIEDDGEYIASAILNACIFVSGDTSAASWHSARTTCLSKGGDLLRLSGQADHDEAIEILDQNRTGLHHLHWIGFFRENFYWNEAEGVAMVDMMWSNFAAGEPNYLAGSCVYADPGDGYMWKVAACGLEQPLHVCQQDNSERSTDVMTPTPTIPTGTSDNVTVPVVVPTKGGASTTSSAWLQENWWVLLLLCLLVVVAIALLATLCYYKSRATVNKVGPGSYDAREGAHVASGYTDVDREGTQDWSDTSSHVNLVYNGKSSVPKKAGKKKTPSDSAVYQGSLKEEAEYKYAM